MKHTIDGVEIEFQMAPGTEAPAEMHFYSQRYRALCMAENATHNLHNLLTLRGALVRDPHVWSGYLTEAIHTFTDRADVVFASHHWPTWGKDRIVEYLSLQRICTPICTTRRCDYSTRAYGPEIAEQFQMPPALEKAAHAWLLRLGQPQRQGGLPAVHGLVRRQPGAAVAAPTGGAGHPLRRRDRRGGPRRRTRPAGLRAGDFRWAATLLDHAVFADPDHAAARALHADTLEQLAYGSENATWRNFFCPVPWNCGPATSARRHRPRRRRCCRSSPRSRCSTRSRSTSTGRGPGTSTSPSTSPSSTPRPTTG